MAETQPELQLALLTLSAMISQYFTSPTPLVRVPSCLRCGLTHFKLGASLSWICAACSVRLALRALYFAAAACWSLPPTYVDDRDELHPQPTPVHG